MKRIWDFINMVISSFLIWCDQSISALVMGGMISYAGFMGADPNPGISKFNPAFLAFLAGSLMVAMLLAGSAARLGKYNFRSLLFGVAGALIGVLLASV